MKPNYQGLTNTTSLSGVAEKGINEEQHLDSAEDILFPPACVLCPTYECERLIRKDTFPFVAIFNLLP